MTDTSLNALSPTGALVGDQTRASSSKWEILIPWFLTIASTATLVAIAVFLVENILWFRESALANVGTDKLTYRLHVYHLHIAMIKRSVGLFSGFALLFLGTAVVFYTLRHKSTVNVGTGVWSANVATASPGILAMVLAVLLIMFTVGSKDDFPYYDGETSATPNKTSPTKYVPYPETNAK